MLGLRLEASLFVNWLYCQLNDGNHSLHTLPLSYNIRYSCLATICQEVNTGYAAQSPVTSYPNLSNNTAIDLGVYGSTGYTAYALTIGS